MSPSIGKHLRNRREHNIHELLLQRDASIEITEAIVTAAAGNWRIAGRR
jgi:hypothetical protein